jgi:hypothetical protein
MMVVFGSLLTGCKGKSALQEDSPEGQHLRKVADLCREYSLVKKKSPSQLDEVKEWAIKEGKASDDDFISTRDQQPYGVVSLPMGGQFMVYEQVGKSGQCYMITMGKVTELAKEDLDKQVENFKSVRTGPAKGGGKGGGPTR